MSKKNKEQAVVENSESVSVPLKTESIAHAVALLSTLPSDKVAEVLSSLGSLVKEDATASEINAKDAALESLKKSTEKDLAEAFGDENLPSDMRLKLTTIFESNLNTRLNLEVETLHEQFDELVEERVAERVGSLIEDADAYLTRAAETFIEENKVAIDSTLKSEIAESVLEGVRGVLIDHNFAVPEGADDIVSVLEAKNADLEARLNASLQENIDLSKRVSENTKETTFEKVAEGLSVLNTEKLRTLCEGIEASDTATFEAKAKILREKYFAKKDNATALSLLSEQIDNSETVEAKTVPENMKNYVSFMESLRK